MAGKGPKHDSKDGHHARENHRSKENARRPASPPARPASGHRPSNFMDSDPALSMIGHPMGGQPPPLMVEQKLAAQHAEIQRLLGENQRLAVTHITLRQELAAAQQEMLRMLQNRPLGDAEKEQRFTFTQVALRQELADAQQELGRLQEAIAALQAENQQLRVNVERTAHMDAELKGVEALKSDFEKMRLEREELMARVEVLTAELKKLPMKDQEITSLKSEVDELRQRHQQARMDFEHQKKINLERLEQMQTMDRNTFTMAREVERLRGELVNMERRLHGAHPVSSGGIARPPQPAGAYENNYGSQQEVTKSGQVGINPSESKSFVEAGKYRDGMEAGIQGPQDHIPTSGNPEGEWVQHTSSNGKLYYYNVVTGATQWHKPSVAVGGHTSRGPEGQAASNPSSERGLLPVPQHQPPPAMQPPPSQQSVSPATMQQGGQLQAPSANYGVNLLVLGLSEGISDRDLAGLFNPYGVVLRAKVMVDNKPGSAEYYGIVTMETGQSADAAAAAVNGMFILGRHIKVEIQGKEQWPVQQQGYPHQQNMMQGGVGPVRWQQQRAAAPAGGGHWPY